jgi:hypothetical protein
VAEQQAELDAMVLEQHKAAGIHGFREAVKLGRLEVHSFRETSAEAIVEAMLRGGGNLLYGIDLVDVLEEYIDQVSGAVADGSTYPVFDDLTGDFVAEAVRAGLITSTEASADSPAHQGRTPEVCSRTPRPCDDLYRPGHLQPRASGHGRSNSHGNGGGAFLTGCSTVAVDGPGVTAGANLSSTILPANRPFLRRARQDSNLRPAD